MGMDNKNMGMVDPATRGVLQGGGGYAIGMPSQVGGVLRAVLCSEQWRVESREGGCANGMPSLVTCVKSARVKSTQLWALLALCCLQHRQMQCSL